MTHLGRISPDGRTTIPEAIREALGLTPGTEVEWRLDGDRAVLVHKKARPDTLAGSLQEYAGTPMTEAQIDAVITEAIQKDDERIKSYGVKGR